MNTVVLAGVLSARMDAEGMSGEGTPLVHVPFLGDDNRNLPLAFESRKTKLPAVDGEERAEIKCCYGGHCESLGNGSKPKPTKEDIKYTEDKAANAGDCCHTCPCTTCGSVMDKAIQDTARVQRIAGIMGYQFDPLIHRMVDKYQWDEVEARAAFEDLKRFLALCATSKESVVPSPVVDEFWHNFILFTQDYEAFCQEYVGHFVHHRPRRRGEQIRTSEGGNAVEHTLRLAQQTFGELSQHWAYPLKGNAKAKVQGECEPTCGPDSGCACNKGVSDSPKTEEIASRPRPVVHAEGDCDDCAPVSCGHR